MIKVDPPAIRALGETIEREVGPALDACTDLLASARAITHSNFTSVVPHLAVAYVGAVEFVEEELRSKREHLTEIRSRLSSTADNWEATETASTIATR
ncbi:hypothetical protein Q3W71_11800 [Micromonospora sp. C28SCA-DRY-2]|uniref:hypothetical protein n=1 Tax=Micromonospora sp. C28SCA-DRY-2 TaxID=3059522 RepID=UPI00267736B2|nr:hypothetical protein [Micromonospora sp. C28SCA-DRY-2]MDO3702361.1 hypothetical protein [Micromonospora sp. C28SCA-DRY-2]